MAELNENAREKLDKFLAKRSFGEKFSLGRALSNLRKEDKNKLIADANGDPRLFEAMERYYDPKEKPPDLVALCERAKADLIQREPQPVRTTLVQGNSDPERFFGSNVEIGVPVLAGYFNAEVENAAPGEQIPAPGGKPSHHNKSELTA